MRHWKTRENRNALERLQEYLARLGPLRWVVRLLFLLTALVLYLLLVKKSTVDHPEVSGTLLIGGLLAGLLIIEWVFSRTTVKVGERISFLENTTGRPGYFAQSLGFGTTQGFLVALWQGEKALGVPWRMARLGGMDKRQRLTRKGQAVVLHFGEDSSGQHLVLDGGGFVLFGAFIDREAFADSCRQLRQAYIVFGLLALCTLLPVGWISGRLGDKVETTYELAVASHGWPTATGEIRSAKLNSVRIPMGKGSRPGFRADIVYRYRVDGQRYGGSTIYFGYRPTEVRGDSSRWIEQFVAGTSVEVLYHPDRPKISTLLPGDVKACAAEVKAYRVIRSLLYGVSLLLIVLPLVLLIILRRRSAVLIGLFQRQ